MKYINLKLHNYLRVFFLYESILSFSRIFALNFPTLSIIIMDQMYGLKIEMSTEE